MPSKYLKVKADTQFSFEVNLYRNDVIFQDEESVMIMENTNIILTNDMALCGKCNKHQIFIDNPGMCIEIPVGAEINIEADEIILRCTEIIDNKSMRCVVKKGGNLKSLYNVCVRGRKYTLPLITAQDKAIIKFAMTYQVSNQITICNKLNNRC